MAIQESQSLAALAEMIFTLRFEAMPAWLDVNRIACLDDRAGVMQLVAGDTRTGSRRQLTGGAERIQSMYAAAGSDHVLVGSDAGGNERQEISLIDVGTGERRTLTDDPGLMHEPFLVSTDGAVALYRVNDGASGEFSLYRIELQSGEATCIWDDAGQVRAHAIDPEGRVLASLLTSNLDADLYLIETDGSRRPVLQVADESWIVDAAFIDDGARALVLTNAGRDVVGIFRLDLSNGALEPLVAGDHDVEMFSLSPDGGWIAWAVNDEGYSSVHLAAIDAVDAPVVARLPDGVVDRIAWSPDGSRLAVGWTPVDRPARIWIVKRDGSARIAFPEEPDDAEFTGTAPDVVRFETFDGRSIPAYWFESSQPDAPVVIDVHGGPESQRRAGFHPVLQYLAAAGFHVLSTNVRGSTGYGKAYSHLDDVERRMDSVRDLRHAHDWVVARLGAERARVAVMGQSYGGFMTLAAITEYPDLWYAAVDVVGICNFVTFLERTGSWRRRHRSAEYGTLERDRDLLERISPIRKVYAIEAPLLVIHGRNDPRVPLYEAEQLVEALEHRSHPVELLVFDNEGHGLSKRPNRIVGYTRAAEFLRTHAANGRNS
jgi:dipeptidyl aminopeptidase/acylaminoacyl peptidase